MAEHAPASRTNETRQAILMSMFYTIGYRLANSSSNEKS
jgi:hypothetical protein